MFYDSFDDSMEFGLENRPVLRDRTLRIYKSPVFVGEKPTDPILVFNMVTNTDVGLDNLKNLTSNNSYYRVKKLYIYYVPRIIRTRFVNRNIIKTNNDTIAELRRTKDEYGIRLVAPEPRRIKSFSCFINMGYYLERMYALTIGKKMKLTKAHLTFLNMFLRNFVEKFPCDPKYKNKVIYFKGPFLAGTGVKTRITPMILKRNFSPLIFLLHWMQEDEAGFKAWLRDNNISIVLDAGDKGVIVLSKNELQHKHSLFRFKPILRLLHRLDRGIDLSEGDYEDDGIDDVEDLEDTSSDVYDSDEDDDEGDTISYTEIDKSLHGASNKVVDDEVDEIKHSVDNTMQSLDEETDSDDVEEENAEDEEDIIKDDEPEEEEIVEDEEEETDEISDDLNEDKPKSKSNVDDLLYDDSSTATDVIVDSKDKTSIINKLNSEIPDEEKGLTLKEMHRYSELGKLNENTKTKHMRQKLVEVTKTSLEDAEEVIRSHKLEPKTFKGVPSNSSFAKSSLDNLQEAYDTKLYEKDLMNVIASPANTSVPLFLDKYEMENLNSPSFKGYLLKLRYKTQDGTIHNMKVQVPVAMEDGAMYFGAAKKRINRQDAYKPVVKVGTKVVLTTAYNKMIVTIKGKYGSIAGKGYISAFTAFNNVNKVFVDQTVGAIDYLDNTGTYNNFIFDNRVSYDTLNVVKTFVKMEKGDDIKIDFRGVNIITDKNELAAIDRMYGTDERYKKVKSGVITNMGSAFGHKVLHNPDMGFYFWDGISYENVYEVIAAILTTVDANIWSECEKLVRKKQTLHGVNKITIKLMNRDLPMILVLMICYPFKDILDRLVTMGAIKYNVYHNSDKVKKLRSNNKYGVIKFNDRTLVIEYTDTMAQILLMPLINFSYIFEEHDLISVTKLYNSADFARTIVREGNLPATLENYITNFKELFIDPMTARLLDYYNLPKDFMGLLLYAASLCTSHMTTEEASAKNLRLITTNELINRVLYRAIAQSVSAYVSKVKTGHTAKLEMKLTQITDDINKLVSEKNANDMSPFRSISDGRAKTIKGQSGLNSDGAFKMSLRKFDPKSIGTQTCGTAYSAEAGVWKVLPFNPVIKDITGSYAPVENSEEVPISSQISFIDSFVPYAYNDSAPRLLMCNGQFNHVIDVKDADTMLISSRADEAAIYMSPEHAYVAKDDGEIIDVNDDYLVVKYKDGKQDVVGINRIERNVDKGLYLENQMAINNDLKVGSKFKKDDILAYNKLWFKKKTNGKLGLCAGPLAHVLVCDAAEDWEDACLMFSRLSEKMGHNVVKRFAKVIDLNFDIMEPNLNIGGHVEPGDVLFKYKEVSEDPTMQKIFSSLNDFAVSEVTSHYSGTIDDIRVYWRSDKDVVMSDSIKKFIDDVTKAQRKYRHTGSVSGLKDSLLKDDFKKHLYNKEPMHLTADKFSKINGSRIDDGRILIEYYISIPDRVGPGDKIVISRALKNETAMILPFSEAPVGSLTGKKVDMMSDTYGFLNRMTGGMMLEGMLNTILLHDAIKNRHILDMPPEKDSLLDYKSCKAMVDGKMKYSHEK